jgi:FtsX-like permease family protein
VLASFTLARDNGVGIGSVLRPQLITPAQLETGKGKPDPALRPALRVVGIVASEVEFPSGAAPHYDLFATTAYAAAFNHRTALLQTYYVRLAHGGADLAAFDGRFRSPDVYGTSDLDAAADAVQASIRPQVIGWYGLTGLAALAALAVIAQAMARQAATERADHDALSTLGVRPREFVLLALLRTLLTGAAGAAGAMLIAVLASPLTPVGEARLAVPSPGRVSLDLAVVLPGALTVLAAALAVSVWPAIRQARLLRNRPQWQPATATVAAGRAAAQARLPAPALIGIRHAFERGRDGEPVGTALLGTVMAVAALCATAVFGASLTHQRPACPDGGDDAAARRGPAVRPGRPGAPR